jgi:hypothetical protein
MTMERTVGSSMTELGLGCVITRSRGPRTSTIRSVQSDTAYLSNFFPVGRSAAAPEPWRGMLGMVWLGIGTLWGLHTRALIAASIALVPTIFMTRVRLEASTLRAILLAPLSKAFWGPRSLAHLIVSIMSSRGCWLTVMRPFSERSRSMISVMMTPISAAMTHMGHLM